jgi:hypothetical protein
VLKDDERRRNLMNALAKLCGEEEAREILDGVDRARAAWAKRVIEDALAKWKRHEKEAKPT